MSVYVGSARIDENGNATGGKAGDQTGKEVSTQVWYDHKKGWVLLRCADPVKRRKIADCMRAACANNNIGYDQNQRDSLFNAVKDASFDVSAVAKAVECDCSSLVRVCVNYAGISCPNFRTATEVSTLVKTGFFKKITDAKYTKSPDFLLEGDILVTSVSGHTVVVLNDGRKASSDTEWEDETAEKIEETQPNAVTVGEGTFFLRRGPGKQFPHDDIWVIEGTVLEKVEAGEWIPVLYKNKDGTLDVRWLGASGVRKE